MLLDLSSQQFKDIVKNPSLNLPVRWDGRDFEMTVENLLDEYIKTLISFGKGRSEDQRRKRISCDVKEINEISILLKKCIHQYHQGFPATAFSTFQKVMKKLMVSPLRIYQKSGALGALETDQLHLFRLRSVKDTTKHSRKDVFHVPSCARSMISSCRYSIAGYPSLYLTTSIELGVEEIGNRNNIIVSRFKLMRMQQVINIKVLELGIKPQDFCEDVPINEYINSGRVTNIDLMDDEICSSYLRWYPLIAACSFIRANKSSPFSSEYIVPQLLMQWIRKQVKKNELMGIRYFSCASIRASNLGYDYVFPVNNTDYEEGYCSILRDSFSLTEPVYIKDFESIYQCEEFLINCGSSSFGKI